MWADLDILKTQHIERLWSTLRWGKYVRLLRNILISETGWSLKMAWHSWAAFFSTQTICSFHVRLKLIVTVSKCFVELACSNGTLLQFMYKGIGGLWLLNKIVLLLDRFSVSLFFCNQLNSLFNSKWVIFSKVMGSFHQKNVMLCHQQKLLQKNWKTRDIINIQQKKDMTKSRTCGRPQLIRILSGWTLFA